MTAYLAWEEEVAPYRKQMRLHAREATPHEKEALDRRPPCDEQATIVIDAFHDLAGDKQLGFGVVGLIPYTAWLAWASEQGLDWHARQALWPVLQQVDRQHFERDAERRRVEQEQKR